MREKQGIEFTSLVSFDDSIVSALWPLDNELGQEKSSPVYRSGKMGTAGPPLRRPLLSYDLTQSEIGPLALRLYLNYLERKGLQNL